MSIVLHRFPISHFSEKGRVLLDLKGLDYTIREHALGLPQRAIVKLSGQRRVPVIEHDGRVVSDSTRIARYLDERFPDRRRLIPLEDPGRSEVIALEDRFDKILGFAGPAIWLDYITTERQHDQIDLLPLEVQGLPRFGARLFARGVRVARTLGVGESTISRAKQRTRDLLLDCVRRLARTKYLVGDEPSLADAAAVGLVLHLEYPRSRHLAPGLVAGRGVPAFAEDPVLRPFFEWRRAFYERFVT